MERQPSDGNGRLNLSYMDLLRSIHYGIRASHTNSLTTEGFFHRIGSPNAFIGSNRLPLMQSRR